jgi:hypothetical protein
MNTSKFLSDGGWKDVASKHKLKDNGLLKALSELKRLGDDKHDEALKLLDEALKLIGQLKKAKDVAAAAPAAKYLGEVAGAAEAMQRDVAKGKAEAARQAKAEADKKAKAEAAKKSDDDEDDDDESPEILSTKMVPLLRLVAKGQTMHTLVAKSGKQVVVMLSRKPIPPARRKLLADQLGGGSTKYYPGHCALEGGKTTFVLRAEVAGMAKLIKAALLGQTGLRFNKLKARGDDGDDDDDDEDEGGAAASPPSADEAPPPALADASVLALGKARGEWSRAREHALRELARLRQLLQDEYRDAGDEQAQLATALRDVDATIAAIDDELGTRLDALIEARPDQRGSLIAAAKAALERSTALLAGNRILLSVDGNELAPDMKLAGPLRERLRDIATALG